MKRDYVQMLTREQFDKLFGRLSEAETPAVADDQVLKWYRETGRPAFSRGLKWDDLISTELGMTRPDPDDFDKYDEWLDVMDNYDSKWLDAAKRIIRDTLDTDLLEFAGAGSMKVTLVSKSGHAVKFQRNGGHISREIGYAVSHSNRYSCLPRLFDYAKDGTSYVCECATESKPDDFKRLLGYPSASALVDAILDEDPELMRKLERPSEPKWKSVADLIRFFDDVEHLTDIDENNWGLTVREGKPVLILIDYDL